jgi:hypothetical protein
MGVGKNKKGEFSPTNFDVGGFTLNIREGLIPTALGSAVTATGYVLKQKRGSNKMIANTVFGFGLAHVVLGVIDLVEHRR